MGDLALAFPLQLAKKVKANPRKIAQEVLDLVGPLDGVTKAEIAGAGFINLFLDRKAFFRERALAAGAVGPRARRGQDHHRAHEHQPQQGRPHRPPPERRPRRHAGPLPAVQGRERRGPELHRRHGRPGRRRRFRHPGAREEGHRRSRGARGQVRLLLLGPLRPGLGLSRRPSRGPGPEGRDHEGDRARDGTRRPTWPATSPGGSCGPTSRPCAASASATTSCPARAASSTSSSGKRPSPCSRRRGPSISRTRATTRAAGS